MTSRTIPLTASSSVSQSKVDVAGLLCDIMNNLPACGELCVGIENNIARVFRRHQEKSAKRGRELYSSVQLKLCLSPTYREAETEGEIHTVTRIQHARSRYEGERESVDVNVMRAIVRPDAVLSLSRPTKSAKRRPESREIALSRSPMFSSRRFVNTSSIPEDSAFGSSPEHPDRPAPRCGAPNQRQVSRTRCHKTPEDNKDACTQRKEMRGTCRETKCNTA